jgi:hypothetical protein
VHPLAVVKSLDTSCLSSAPKSDRLVDLHALTTSTVSRDNYGGEADMEGAVVATAVAGVTVS